MQPVETTGPKVNQPVYPVIIAEDPQRRDSTLLAARQLLAQNGTASNSVVLQPVTATIQSIPSNQSPTFLPKLGTKPVMSEEEARESVRRFIESWRGLIGADPSELSLTSWVAQPDQTIVANYEQRPFRYELRGNYGKLQIRFGPDRRVLGLTSTCIPDADHLQTSLYAITPTVKREDAVKYVQQNDITYSDESGRTQSFRVGATANVNPRELVFYVLPATPDTLAFHLAWAVDVTDAPVKTIYLDAVDQKVIAAE